MTGKSKDEYNIVDDFLRIMTAGLPKSNISYTEAGWRLSYLPYAVDTESSETAIILGNEECFLILYGDHREQLRGKTRDEACAYWRDNPELHGATSGTLD